MNENNQNKIEDYLYGRMTPGEKESFEQAIKDDNELLKAVETQKLEQAALKLLSQDMLRAEMANWKREKNNEVVEKAPAKIRRLSPYRLAIAASILLLVGIPFWWANQHFSNAAIASSALGIRTSATDRSNISSNNPILPVLDLMKEKRYDEAISELQVLMDSPYQEEAKLILGELYTSRGQYTEAATLYSDLSTQSSDISIRQKSEWLLANTLLASGATERAERLFQRIATDSSHQHQAEAQEVMNQLNSFWRTVTFN